MDPQDLSGILKQFGKDLAWQQQRQFQLLQQQWEDIVGVTVAAQTKPVGIQRQVLQVATATAVWAQNLSFERQRILRKVRQIPELRSLPLKDIRFSTAQWHNAAPDLDRHLQSFQQQLQWQQHPSRLPESLPTTTQQKSQQKSLSFETWRQQRRYQNAKLPACPRCHCPTPEGELERWSVCAFCMSQQWQADKTANEHKG